MKLETLMPLGKVDPGLRSPDQSLDLGAIAETARLLEDIGYAGLITEETKDDPFVIMALAAAATSTLHLGTGVAIAPPRSPTVMAQSAWTIQKLSQGRFTLGLGTQVRGHITRRFGMDWHAPGPWMRDYVGAIRAVWNCWQNGSRLAFESEHFNLNLMVPLFDAGPIDHPDIPIHLAAVKPVMSRMAGEVADGLRPHPVCTPSYITEVMLPAVREGAAKAGRDLGSFDLCMKPLVASARNEAELAPKIEDARARIAFYASTPAYADAFAHLGLQDLTAEARQLSKAQDWDALPALVSDDVLHEFAIIGTYDTIGKAVADRWAGIVTHAEFSIAVKDDADREILRQIAADIQAQDESIARQTIISGQTFTLEKT